MTHAAPRRPRPLLFLALVGTLLLGGLAQPAQARGGGGGAGAAGIGRLLAGARDPAPPTSMVLFGATGDLARRKIVPALTQLMASGQLPEDFSLVAISRDPIDPAEQAAQLRRSVAEIGKVDVNSPAWRALEQRIVYMHVDTREPKTVEALRSRLDALDRGPRGPRQRLFYLSIPASGFRDAVAGLRRFGLIGKSGAGARARLVVEKPFGRNLEEAQALNRELDRAMGGGDRVLRMDHYLGKKGVLDLMALRAVDRTLEPAWNRDYISRVSIRASESIGIEGRASFYEETGALRDFVQGHMMQMLAATAMETPRSAGELGRAMGEVVRTAQPFTRERMATDVVRGQYEGYRDQPGVAPDSRTETYVGMRMELDSPRWRGVPFLLETGKALEKKSSAITVEFRALPPEVAKRLDVPAGKPATLTVQIDPRPEMVLSVGDRRIDLSARGASRRVSAEEPYARLLGRAMHGESSLFVRGRAAEAAWRLFDPVLRSWKDARDIPRYRIGSERPAVARRLWRRPGGLTELRTRLAAERGPRRTPRVSRVRRLGEPGLRAPAGRARGLSRLERSARLRARSRTRARTRERARGRIRARVVTRAREGVR